jgi:hypothetical protein
VDEQLDNESILFIYFCKRMDLTHVSNLKHLDLIVCQVQVNVSLARMSDPIHFNLTVSQVKDNVSLT